MRTLGIVLLLVLSDVLKGDKPMSSDPVCPHVCDACFAGLYFCQHGGLTGFPENANPNSVKVHFSNHNFTNPRLQRRNLTVFQRVQRLWLRNCSLGELDEDTFADIKYSLNLLDLSYNRLRYVPAGVFNGLNLTSLHLSHNPNLQLVSGVFDGLQVRVLSLEGCNLRHLEVSLFTPLLMATLQTLDLKQNLLHTLDPELEHVFNRIEVVNLNGNPVSCSCSMVWLQRVYWWKWRVLNSRKKLDSSMGTATSMSSEEATFPVCAEPNHLKGLFFHRISTQKMYCEPPSLEVVEVEYLSQKEVLLTCRVHGSPEALVRWKRADNTSLPSIDSLHNETKVKLQRPGDASLKVVEDVYCVAKDKAGEAVTLVKLFWPYLNNTTSLPVNSMNTSITQPISTDTMNTLRFTLVQLLSALLATVVVTLAFTLAMFHCLRQCCLNQRRRSKNRSKRGPHRQSETMSPESTSSPSSSSAATSMYPAFSLGPQQVRPGGVPQPPRSGTASESPYDMYSYDTLLHPTHMNTIQHENPPQSLYPMWSYLGQTPLPLPPPPLHPVGFSQQHVPYGISSLRPNPANPISHPHFS